MIHPTRGALLACLLLLGMATLAQDTIRVQAFTFDDITRRRGWFQFPDTTHRFRKVLMHHTLKCDPQTTQDQYACGEWDYLTYNFVHEHTGVLDSNAVTHPYFLVGHAAPASVDRAALPHHHIRRTALPLRTVTSVVQSSEHSVGAGAAWDASLLGDAGNSRMQFIVTAAELSAAGAQAGELQQLRFHTDGTGTPGADRFTIRLKHTALNSLTGFDGNALVTVFDAPVPDLGASAAAHTFTFNQPFAWNGTSNLLVDVAVERPVGAAAVGMQADPIMAGQGVQAHGPDGYLSIADDIIAVDPAPMAALSTAVTIMFRVRGDAVLPINNSILEALDAEGRRMLNVHLPWSDGRVYWDAGNDGSGWDRIDKAATVPNTEGQWNHWAFVKNTTTGSMRIYLNGTLWHSGTGKTRPLSGISRFRFGNALSSTDLSWPGDIDEINVFATEVAASDIAAWKDRAIDATHPDAASLLYSLHCDEATDVHMLGNGADAATPAWAMGTVTRRLRAATEIHHGVHAAAFRPRTTFVQGVFESSSTDLVIERAEALPLLTEEYYHVEGNHAVPFDTVFAFTSGQVNTYEPDGSVVDAFETPHTTDLNDTLHYFAEPFELVNDREIGRFITPYGIGLSLGANGFRWTYDVTDYQWMLHDSVELSAGNQQELIDLEFEMIEGIPPRYVVAHQMPWGNMASRSYADLSADVALPPVEVQLSPQAQQWMMRTRLTGHGHNSNTGAYPHCCEWKDNTHYLHLNGTQVDAWHIWQEHDCALNPVYPQGGTWPGAREGWCPGDLVKDHEVTLPGLTPGGTATVDYSITPVPANNLGMGGGNYVINMDLFEFGAPAHALDAEIVEVKRPSTTDMHRRMNPICYAPLVVLRNAGGEDLTSVTFTYAVSGGVPRTHTWTGLLHHMERAEVELPVDDVGFWSGDGQDRFEVAVSQPNGGADAYADNDVYTTRFTLPTVYQHDIVLHYKTNNRPQETSVRVLDIAGNVLHSRTVHAANTQYIDTLGLGPGCYTFEMLDTGNDGLSYWADPGAGSGYSRLKRPNGQIVRNFLNEFGRTIHFPFTIANGVGVEEVHPAFSIGARPNPSDGRYELAVTGVLGDAELLVMDVRGTVVMRRTVALYGGDRLPLDLTSLAAGIYQVRLSADGDQAVVRVVKE